MTHEPRDSRSGRPANRPANRGSSRSGAGRGQQRRHFRPESRGPAAVAEPQTTKYSELLQELQDEVCYFLPVDALATGTHRYLYHLGDYSRSSIDQMGQFLSEKRGALSKLEQGRLSGNERRSALVLGSYIDSLTRLLTDDYFAGTLWQMRNCRRGLYQLLYMKQIPSYVRGKALLRRLDELATPPTSPDEHISLQSGVHQCLAMQELDLLQQYLLFAEERASRFDDKQAIMERITKARQQIARIEPRLAHWSGSGETPSNPIPAILVPSLNDDMLRASREHLDHEIDSLRKELAQTARSIDASRSVGDVVNDVVHASRERRLDQETIDNWMSRDYPRLRSFFPSYKLRSIPVAADIAGTIPPYDGPESVALRGAALEHWQTACPIPAPVRWLSPEIALMMTYFPGRAYIETAIAAWDPHLPLHFQREVFITGLATFELQNIVGLDGVLTLENGLLSRLQLLIEDLAAVLDIEILEHRLSHIDTEEFLRQEVLLPDDLAAAYSAIATVEYGTSLARFLLRSRLRDMRRISRASNKKVSWTSFYQSIFEQGTFNPSLLENP